MRYKNYYVYDVLTKQKDCLLFDPLHYKEMGFDERTAALGMPILEAHQLVNRWNTMDKGENNVYYTYWLAN